MHNHLETTLANRARVRIGREYEISFRARWFAGSNQLHTRLYFNMLPRTTHLAVPDLNGTPGAPNSMAVENLGPTFSGLAHEPPVPPQGEDVTVRVEVQDPDGVDTATLWWQSGSDEWAGVEMVAAGDVYRGVIPGQPRGRVVHFYVEARDGRGAVSVYPAGGAGSRALFAVEDGQARRGDVHNFRIVMTPEDSAFLYLLTNVMSNDRIGCTVIYDEREIFYDVGIRMRGSERGRPTATRVSYNVRFRGDQLFRGVHPSVSIDRSGGGSRAGQEEILIKHIINHAGGAPGMYDDLIHVIAPRPQQTGSALLLMGRYGPVFLDSQWEDGNDGTLYNFELIYYPTTTVDGNPESLKRPQPDSVLGTDLRNLGDDKEAYRWNFTIENNEARDDYSRVVDMCQAFSVGLQQMEESVRQVIDVNEWARAYALVTLCGVGDMYTFGNNHNAMFWVRPSDSKVLFFPWDMDFSFTRSATSSLTGDQNLGRLMTRPGVSRLLLGHVQDIVQTTYNREYMDYWISHYGALAGQNMGSISSYIAQRRSFALSRVPREVEFEIVTNDGNDFETEDGTVRIDGNAWVNALTVLVLAADEPLEVSWPGTTRWQLNVPLRPGLNEIIAAAFDREGNLVGTDAIRVTRGGLKTFLRGDVDLNGAIEISDAVRILFHIIRGQPVACADAADVDNNEALNITDAIHLLQFLFRGGDAPAAPFPQPGFDPDGKGPLDCEQGLQ
jgi:hypothetical protein